MKATLVTLLIALLLQVCTTQAQVAQGEQFTYQAQLRQAGAPANGNIDLAFALYDAAVGGTRIGDVVSRPQTAVIDGLFSVELQFPGAFDGSRRWLQVTVDGQILAPRQAVNAAPVALYALSGNEGPTGPPGLPGEDGAPGPQGPAGGSFADAPSDGMLYARRNGSWESVSNSGGPSLMAEILADAPTLYYPLDEPAGSSGFADLGMAGIDVAISGDPVTFRPGYSHLFPTSDAKYLRLFEGNGKASAAGNPTGTPTPSGPLTVEAIYSPATNGAGNQPWLFIGDGGGADPLLWFGVVNLQPRIIVGAQERVDLAGLVAGRSYHVAAVVDTSLCQVRIYVNGRLLEIQSICGFAGTLVNPVVQVGSEPDADRPFAYSTLGHVAYYHGQALPEARIVAHAKAAGLYGY